ncbi:GTP-binding protein Era [Hesseltinella vesiculosa]|uniref:GTP-binding protein Era n=1 Tax=Hesseltinella vesiculosa TaxID=101127 RepID=A0A1X2GRP8_9FUNG|nr:GTP-binding protein Era [Hesseltinella vesiculosa]
MFRRLVGTQCCQGRSYAIMTRAKRQAGIPLRDRPAPAKAAVPSKATRTKPAQPIRHPPSPATMTERLVKPIQPFDQPDNPHLLKVALLGAPNAGKSTLINKLIGEEISIVSSKSHTTRDRILAILSEDNHQVIFLDTPGIVAPKSKQLVHRSVSTSSWRALDEVDHVMIIIDGRHVGTDTSLMTQEYMLNRLQGLQLPATLVINKMDALEDHSALDDLTHTFQQSYPHLRRVLYVSALYEEGLEKIKSALFEQTQPKAWLYPPQQRVEMAELKRVEEVIRGEFFKRLHQYLPYMLKQENVDWTVLPNGALRIEQNVFVERDSQHKIVVGTNGAIIDQVVRHATKTLCSAFQRPVKLFIQVKTKRK